MIIARDGKIVFNRQRRRLLVSGAGTCYMLGIGTLLIWFHHGGSWLLWAGGFGVGIAWLSVWPMRHWTGLITERHDAFVDEREQALRNTAYRLAHRVLGWALALWYMYFTFDGPNWTSGTHLPLQWAFAVVFGILYHALPPAMIAWLAPDPPREGEQD